MGQLMLWQTSLRPSRWQRPAALQALSMGLGLLSSRSLPFQKRQAQQSRLQEAALTRCPWLLLQQHQWVQPRWRCLPSQPLQVAQVGHVLMRRQPQAVPLGLQWAGWHHCVALASRYGGASCAYSCTWVFPIVLLRGTMAVLNAVGGACCGGSSGCAWVGIGVKACLAPSGRCLVRWLLLLVATSVGQHCWEASAKLAPVVYKVGFVCFRYIL